MKIRTIVAVTALAAMALPVAAQHRCCHSVSVPDTVQCTRLQYYIDMQHQNKYTELWGQRATIFEALPVDTNDIVMLGNSLTHGCEWHELLGMPNVLNRGIIGDDVPGIYERLHRRYSLARRSHLERTSQEDFPTGRCQRCQP